MSPAGRRILLAALLAAGLAGGPACGGDEASGPAARASSSSPASATKASSPAAAPADGAPDGRAAPARELAPLSAGLLPDQVAVIDGAIDLTWSDLDRYLGTVYSRLPEGEDALQQLVTETIIDQAAAANGVTASDEEIAALQARLEAQSREATGGKSGLKDSLGPNVTPQDLRAAMRLQVLHEKIVRREEGLPADAPVEPSRLKAWIDEHMPGGSLVTPPLDDPVAARWPGGQLTKEQVGSRLRSILPAESTSGVLTEMIGVHLVHREADRLGLQLTPAEATQEVLDRNKLLQSKAGVSDVTYAQFVETVQKRTLSEVIASEQFGAEVLLRLMAERNWTEEQAQKEWLAHPERYPAPAPAPVKLGGPGVTTAPASAAEPNDWAHMRPVVWRALRQQCYAQLFQQSRIVRRF